MARFKAAHGSNWDLLPEKACFQLNDTHPTIAVAELMRLLVDVEGLEWDKAWGLTTKVSARGFSSSVHIVAWLVDMVACSGSIALCRGRWLAACRVPRAA